MTTRKIGGMIEHKDNGIDDGYRDTSDGGETEMRTPVMDATQGDGNGYDDNSR